MLGNLQIQVKSGDKFLTVRGDGSNVCGAVKAPGVSLSFVGTVHGNEPILSLKVSILDSPCDVQIKFRSRRIMPLALELPDFMGSLGPAV